jgi:SAM-dependent methyltransferase
VDLATEYRRQLAWRDWGRAFDALPALAGSRVLDLGCGVGDQAAALATRGARVLGLDLDEGLLATARARGLAGVEVRTADLRLPLDVPFAADGIWASFTPAYFPDLPAALARWACSLRPDGWIALTEVDDLFGHEPLAPPVAARLATYAREALEEGRYDFHLGDELRRHLEAAGFAVSVALDLADRELAFDGPAEPAVLAAWRARFDRMLLLRERCGPDYEGVRDAFLASLAHPLHRSRARVRFCLATRRGPRLTGDAPGSRASR